MYVLHKKTKNSTEIEQRNGKKSACDKHHYNRWKDKKKFIIWTDSNTHHNGRFRKVKKKKKLNWKLCVHTGNLHTLFRCFCLQYKLGCYHFHEKENKM